MLEVRILKDCIIIGKYMREMSIGIFLYNTNFLYFRSIGVPLPRPINENGARVYFMKFDGDVGKGLVNLDHIYSVFWAMHEVMIMEDPYVCINGVIYIADIKDINKDFVPLFSANLLQKIQHFFKYSSPFYVRSVNFINTPEYFHCAVDILQKVFSEKFCKRVT